MSNGQMELILLRSVKAVIVLVNYNILNLFSGQGWYWQRGVGVLLLDVQHLEHTQGIQRRLLRRRPRHGDHDHCVQLILPVGASLPHLPRHTLLSSKVNTIDIILLSPSTKSESKVLDLEWLYSFGHWNSLVYNFKHISNKSEDLLF